MSVVALGQGDRLVGLEAAEVGADHSPGEVVWKQERDLRHARLNSKNVCSPGSSLVQRTVAGGLLITEELLVRLTCARFAS